MKYKIGTKVVITDLPSHYGVVRGIVEGGYSLDVFSGRVRVANKMFFGDDIIRPYVTEADKNKTKIKDYFKSLKEKHL